MLPRVLGLFDVSVLASAAMGPAYSLAATMGPMVAAAGDAAPLALAALVAIMLCIAVAFARLSRAMPDAGSSFSWIARAFGPGVGSYAAWLLILSNYFATMTTALPAATYTLDLIAPALAPSPFWDAIVGVVWIAASTVLLSIGMRPTAFATAVFLIGELLVVGASSVAALLAHPAVARVVPPPSHFASAASGIVTAMVLGIWMTDGWEVSASASEETTGAAETPGRGGVVGLLVTAAILLFAMVAYLHVGTVEGFRANQSDAMEYVGRLLGGDAWRIAIVVTVLVSTAATLWTTILYLSRSVYAMGRDGVLPPALGRLDARAVPTNALVTIFVCVSLFTLATGLWPTASAVLSVVLDGTSVFLGALFCMSSFAALRMLAIRPGRDHVGIRVVSLGGAVALGAIVTIDVVQSDALTRAIELGGLALGVPFALWRRKGARLAAVPRMTS